VFLFIGLAGLATGTSLPVPEVNPTSGAGALILLSGALLVIRGRWKK
jgi:hypothetical protein